MEKMNFELFVSICKKIAIVLDTICEVKEYKEYGWAGIAFMTDKFGGDYINLHYDIKTNKVVNWFGTKDAKEITDIKDFLNFVKKERDSMLASRNMEEVAELINEQYD